MTPAEIEIAARELEGRPAQGILRWAAGRFAPRITFATGFGVEGCAIVDLIARNELEIDLFTLDTGLLFPATYELWRRLESRYGIVIWGVRPRHSVEEQAKLEGDALWERDPDRCCALRKVEPLRGTLLGYDAWISSIRRDQTSARASAAAVEADAKFDRVKVNPLVAWTSDDVWQYVRDNRVPYNTLHDEGYPSIGCWPCTSPVAPGEDPRAGRWRGKAKKECGLHVRPRSV